MKNTFMKNALTSRLLVPWGKKAPVLLVLAVASLPGAAQTQYVVNNLGDLTGFTYPSPAAINNLGQVAGTTHNADFTVFQGFRTEANSPINPSTDELGLISGATSSSATGINNLGQVAGTDEIPIPAFPGEFFGRAVRADPANATPVDLGPDLDSSCDAYSSNANGINDLGQLTGQATLVDPDCTTVAGFHAYRTLPNGPMSTATDLGALETGNISVGYAINASGQVVGYSNGEIGVFQAPFLATPGTAMMYLGTLGGNQAVAQGINSAGQVVGYSNLANNPPGFFDDNAFLLNPGSTIFDLGTLGGSSSVAYGINKAGQIVGFSTTPGDVATHAFLYQNGSMYDLNDLIPADSGWVLQSASAINDFGQIVGTGTLNGVSSAFRLDPTVAASTLPPNGNNCDGTYQGTFNQDITVSSGQTCYFLSGSNIHGNVTVKKGGNLFLRLVKLWAKMANQGGVVTLSETTVTGNVDIQGGDTSFIDSTLVGNVSLGGGGILLVDPSTISGNLTISNLAAGGGVSLICGTNIDGNVIVTGNASAVMVGEGGACTTNTIRGNLQVLNNTAAVSVIDNKVAGNLQCSGNTSISGSGNTVAGQKQNQCSSF